MILSIGNKGPAWMSISEFGINPDFLEPFMESPRGRDFIEDHRVPFSK